jgi:DNA-directed RNA polymerase specialized sigma24 family protein
MIEYTNSQISQVIDEYIHSERDRAILKRRLIDGICYEPLAEEFDMSVAQIKRIIYKGEDKIYQRMLDEM